VKEVEQASVGDLHGLDVWVMLSTSGWLSLIAASGWIAAPLAPSVGQVIDRLQRPGTPWVLAFDGLASAVALLTVIMPIAVIVVCASSWFGALRPRVRRIALVAWWTWVALGLGGWAIVFSTASPGLGFFLIEALVPVVVGMLIIALFAIAAAAWRVRHARAQVRHV